VFGTRSYGLRSRFLDEIPPELTDVEEPRAATGALPGLARASSWEASRSEPPEAHFHLGEDVVHPAFGEGVVTGVEPGGIVVIRFAQDGGERKLVAGLAPLSRR
jgi:DNA helicase-2/ATP-dependent DNA helicase PcrA